LLATLAAGALADAITGAGLLAAGALVGAADFVVVVVVVFLIAMMAASFPSTATRFEVRLKSLESTVGPSPAPPTRAVRVRHTAHGSAADDRRQQFIGRWRGRKVLQRVTCYLLVV
jgi:hypothetical protein